MNGRVLVFGLAAALVFSGCAAGESAGGPTEEAGLAPSSASVGIIRGVVTDDSLLPIAGVDVTLDGESTVATGADGSFAFTSVPVGSHRLTFSADGFQKKELTLDVQEDQATEVRATLVSAGSLGLYHESMHEAGISLCGITIRDPVTNPNGTASTAGIRWCVLAAQGGQESIDRSQIRWFFKFAGSSGFFSETFWSASSPSNAGMDIIWTPLGNDGASTPGLRGGGRGGGPSSPLRIRVPYEMVQATIKNFTTLSCPLPDCMLLTYHYVRGQTLGPSSPVDAGVGLQQRYDVWVTTFYNGPLPDQFTIRPEG